MLKNNPSHSPHTPIRMAEVLAALSLATDLGTGKTMGHAIRSCYLGLEIANTLHLPVAEQADLYYGFLLMHSGCTVLSLGLSPVIHGDELAAIGDIALRDAEKPQEIVKWLGRHVSPGAPLWTRFMHIIEAMLHSSDAPEQLRGTCEVAAQVAKRLHLSQGVQHAIHYYLERWDGKGPFRVQGEAIPINARLLHAALKIEAYHAVHGPDAAEQWAVAQKGKIFDPQIIESLLAIAKSTDLWATLARPELWDIVLEREPRSPYRYMDETKLDDVALAVADFVDLKSPFALCHSRETAKIAEGIARRMSLPPSEITDIRRAALMRDLGHVALPASILARHDRLSEGDKERLRLHPYYTERILTRVPALASVAAIAGKHHECLDGSGYYRGLTGSELPTSACILALADDFQARLLATPGQPAPEPPALLKAMQPEVGTRFAPECFNALTQEFGLAAPKVKHKQQWPAGLTNREVEVVRLLATGSSNRQIAQELVISEKTVGHHLEHIYNKIGISSRAAAVYFAMEQELLA